MTFEEWRADYYQVIHDGPFVIIDDWHDDDAHDVWLSYVVLPYDAALEAYHREVAAIEQGELEFAEFEIRTVPVV